ncbi:hypothetical protein G6011_08004 [Alternaria panax]|uniref:WW domain-containing protein n=1 Tax=Alternaria panax TaxID=48097 RepID=A0AAD4I1E1_9PLEO|nr:hypothetical protein G6011_08004 [Alternaria panax]
MNILPLPGHHDRQYTLTLDIINESGQPGITPYYYIKNCILAARTQADEKKAELYWLNAEHQYTTSLRDEQERPDDGSLKVLHDLRMELDELLASSPALKLAPIPALPPPLPSFASLSSDPPPPFPRDWHASLDPISGRHYYVHVPTQSTQWDYPGVLPQGWRAYVDSETEEHYYYDTFTQYTQWDFPTEPLVVDGKGKEFQAEFKTSRVGDKVEVEDEMDNEDEDEECEEGDNDYGEDQDDTKTSTEDKYSSVADDLDRLTGSTSSRNRNHDGSKTHIIIWAFFAITLGACYGFQYITSKAIDDLTVHTYNTARTILNRHHRRSQGTNDRAKDAYRRAQIDLPPPAASSNQGSYVRFPGFTAGSGAQGSGAHYGRGFVAASGPRGPYVRFGDTAVGDDIVIDDE